MKRIEIVNEVRTWLDTPFKHQGRLKGVACDCIGLIVGVNKKFNITDYDNLNYERSPHRDLLGAALGAHLIEVPLAQANYGDVLLMRIKHDPQHVAVLTENGTIIHSYYTAGKVIESSLNDWWWNRITNAYRFPNLDDA